MLRLIESVYLIDEQNRLLPLRAQTMARIVREAPNVRDAARYCAQRFEMSDGEVGHKPGERGFPCAGRPPEDH